MSNGPLINGLNKVSYTKVGTGEVTERTVIGALGNAPIRRVIDVTGLTEYEQTHMLELWEEYQAYLDGLKLQTFSFQDYVSHTYNEDIEPKWRAFVTHNIESLNPTEEE